MQLRLILLALLFLFFGRSCIGQLLPIFRPDCSIDTTLEVSSIYCKNIKKPEDVKLLRETLDGIKSNPGHPITLMLETSYLDALSPELFDSYNVTDMLFHNCMTTKLPYDLFCVKTVRLAALVMTQIPGFKLTPHGFKNCNKLKYLSLNNNSLLLVPAGSFQGLESMIEMRIVNNHIALIPEFDGLEDSLETLILGFNPIKFIPKNAFQNLKKLTNLNLQNASITAVQDGAFHGLGLGAQVVLSGNPLNCDCSLKWLQQWLTQHPLEQTEVYCAIPEVAPLMTLDFCNHTTSPSESTSIQPRRINYVLSTMFLITLKPVLANEN